MAWRIGTSGWFYRHWRGRFYPAELSPRSWLSYYAQHFRTTEINRSFYRLPTRQQFAQWAAAVAHSPGFCFAVKASRLITHVHRLGDGVEALQQLLDASEGLGPARGPLLVQLPPSFSRDDERLRKFLTRLPADLPVAFEFRHPSWYTPEAVAMLDRAGCACVLAYGGAHPTPEGWSAFGSFGYLRVHSGRFDIGLTDDEIAWLADRIAHWPGHSAGFVYFNNDLGAHAIADAHRLRARLQAIGIEAI
jgi:uncharacterized protein YecE (DUF72 family)